MDGQLNNTALHWAVFTGSEAAMKALLAAGGCDLLLKNENGCTAAMDAERAGKGELMIMLLDTLKDEDAAAAALGIEEEEEEATAAAMSEGIGLAAGVSQMDVDEDAELRAAGVAGPAAGSQGGDDEPADSGAHAAAVQLDELCLQQQPALVIRERPGEFPEVAQRVAAARMQRSGDVRYSVLPAVVPTAGMVQLSRDFFEATKLLSHDGNTFGPEFEQQYTGHRNYFYYMNRNRVVPGAERAAAIFEALDAYTRAVVELHHPGVAVRLERAFGAYYEGEREHFHLGVNEHRDGDRNLVSTVVHATMTDGNVGFTEGGELTVSPAGGLPAVPIVHSNDTVGSVVYLGSGVYHHASPIKLGGKRLVFCMFYAAPEGTDLSKHALT